MKTNIETGLKQEEVLERIRQNKNNYDTTIKTKSIKDIFRTNICTIFNTINLFLGLLILIVGEYKNLLFLGTIFCNTTIGIIEEIKSKKIIDKLSLVSEQKVTVIRDSIKQKINMNEIVLDDIIMLEPGDQIVTDLELKENQIEVNEALITGEANPILKTPGDQLLSGSYIVSGTARAQVIHVALDNYTYKISKDAKYLKPISSEIMTSLTKIIKLISYIIIPIGIIFFMKQLNIETNTLEKSVVNTVAALIAIIPDGLMLLTSTVMAISVIKLAKHKVLIQELYFIENLARVDTICFDKTGTLTKGTMQVTDFIKYEEIEENIIKEICYNLDNHNPTMNALTKKYGKSNQLKVKKIIEFSSEKKWSGLTFENGKTYIIGAPEYILKSIDKKLNEYIEKLEELKQEYISYQEEILKEVEKRYNKSTNIKKNPEISRALRIVD